MKSRPRRRHHWKGWTYLLIVTVVVAGTGWLLIPALWREGPRSARGDLVDIEATMGGFSTKLLRARAGRPLTVRLTSLDTRFHNDGGGRHQFAIDALGVNIIAPSKGTGEATFTPTAPGVYEFYCDICCGGKTNPTMVGKLVVEA